MWGRVACVLGKETILHLAPPPPPLPPPHIHTMLFLALLLPLSARLAEWLENFPFASHTHSLPLALPLPPPLPPSRLAGWLKSFRLPRSSARPA